MMKATLTLDVPDCAGEIKLKKGPYDLAKDFSERGSKIKRLREIAEERCFDEKELEV